MRRSLVDETRRRQAVAERRFRGHRIRSGLEELGDLDAPPAQKERTEASSEHRPSDTTAAPSLTSPGAATAAFSPATSASKVTPLLSSSPAVSTTVFGADWAEWITVKQTLFDRDATAEAKRAALRTIGVWRLRARKERVLPPYVETTEVLVDAMLQDETDALADGPLRMCYGAAISRVVHVMTGSFATGNADTYRKRAHEIGFPEEAVEVRQRVAHGALPLTSELRWVCGLVLQFVFTEYWLEQERQLYLMKEIDKTLIVAPADTVAAAAGADQVKGKKQQKAGQKTKGSGGASQQAAPVAAAVDAPTVSVDDMKALLADLESDDEDNDGGAVQQTAKPSAETAPHRLDAVATRADKEALKGEVSTDVKQNQALAGGWMLT